jgi:multiple sugar transport system ATP-binding protein
MVAVTLRGLRKRFGAAEVIKGVDLEFAAGEFSVIVGPSGCGKSTLLRMIAGLEEVDEGEVRIGERDVTDADPKDRGVAMVFQNYALYPHMSVRQNLSFALEMARRPKADIDAKVCAVADALHIGELLDRKPSQLSGGQRQRVALGRAIVRDVGVFLFDEPLSNLDAALRVAMRAELARLHRELRCTIVYVTHDQVEAMTLADRIVVLQAGNVMQVGAPLQLYHRPANAFVAGFIGSPRMNFIPVEVASVGPDGATVSGPELPPTLAPTRVDGLAPGDKATLGVRPEHLNLPTEGATAIEGVVELVERLGRETGVRVRTASGLALDAIVDGAATVAAGERLAVGFRPDACHLFNAEGRALERRFAPQIVDAPPRPDVHPLAASATIASRSEQ